MKPSIYLSGPMTGYVDYNFPAFLYVAEYARSHGYPVVCPADFGADPKHSWEDCMKRDLPTMWSCDMVVTLPGWESSRGASLEVYVAQSLSVPVSTLEMFLVAISALNKPAKVLKRYATLAVKAVDVVAPVQEPVVSLYVPADADAPTGRVLPEEPQLLVLVSLLETPGPLLPDDHDSYGLVPLPEEAA